MSPLTGTDSTLSRQSSVSTVVMRGARPNVEQAHAAFVYILIVLGATAGGERWLGIFVAFLGFFVINYFFQPPFDCATVTVTGASREQRRALSTRFVITRSDCTKSKVPSSAGWE